MKYRVIKEYKDAPETAIVLVAAERLKIIEESDPNGDWPNWVYCKGSKKEGWVPKQILQINNDEVVCLEDYNAKEHSLDLGEVLIASNELNGWIWGYKESTPSECAWAP